MISFKRRSAAALLGKWTRAGEEEGGGERRREGRGGGGRMEEGGADRAVGANTSGRYLSKEDPKVGLPLIQYGFA